MKNNLLIVILVVLIGISILIKASLVKKIAFKNRPNRKDVIVYDLNNLDYLNVHELKYNKATDLFIENLVDRNLGIAS